MAWKRFRVGLRWLAGYPAIPNRDGADTFDLSAPFLAVPAPLSPPDGPRSPSTRGGDLKEGLLLPPCASSARSVHTVCLRRSTQNIRNLGLDVDVEFVPCCGRRAVTFARPTPYARVLPPVGRPRHTVPARKSLHASTTEINLLLSFQLICNLPLSPLIQGAVGWVKDRGPWTGPQRHRVHVCFAGAGVGFGSVAGTAIGSRRYNSVFVLFLRP